MTERNEPGPSNQPAVSRDPAFFDQLAQQVIANASLITKYKELVEKSRRLNTEFLKSTWPDYYSDRDKLNEVTNYILSLDSTLTPDEISKIYDAMRLALGYSENK